MITIKHKQTGAVEIISVYEWDRGPYNKELWELIKEENIVNMFLFSHKHGAWLARDRMERTDALKIVEENPNIYRFEDLDQRPANTPNVYPKIKAIYVSIINFLKYEYIKIILTGVIILLIWFFLEPHLKHIFRK